MITNIMQYTHIISAVRSPVRPVTSIWPHKQHTVLEHVAGIATHFYSRSMLPQNTLMQKRSYGGKLQDANAFKLLFAQSNRKVIIKLNLQLNRNSCQTGPLLLFKKIWTLPSIQRVKAIRRTPSLALKPPLGLTFVSPLERKLAAHCAMWRSFLCCTSQFDVSET